MRAVISPSSRAAIVGDLVSTLSTIVIDPPEGHLATYLASLERLLGLGIGVLHPAHGMPQRDGPAIVSSYLAHRRDRERALVRALGTAPRSVAELVREVYADTAPELWPLASRSLEAGLLKLEEEGRARHSGERWARVA
jgi:glyoxylase-like metal-dependent hydrolase (beta-lactamase superfamily II)